MDGARCAGASYNSCYLMSFTVHCVVIVYDEVREAQSGGGGRQGRPQSGLLMHASEKAFTCHILPIFYSH